ncbi:MAG: Npun_F0813 family protein [Cyanobacteria bacterium P01_D01_bin.1]
MFVLPEDVQISSVQHPKRPKRVPILSYQDRTFCLLSVFSAHQQTEAQTAWRELTDNQGKACLLLEEPHRFSLWRLVRIDKGLLNPVLPIAYVKSCLLIIQALYGDVEQLLGRRQAEAFGAALSMNAQKPLQIVGGLEATLRINPLTEGVPAWGEDDLCTLLLELHRLGSRFFGRSHFAPRTLSALDVLPGDDKAVFLTWLRLSLLRSLWLA